MKILARTKPEKAWKLVESAAYDGEKALHKVLAESPSLISIQDVREGASQLVVAIREFPLQPIGYLDLLAFSADGDMALIECKLASNPQIKREVIGQALEYGSRLWQMNYEELDQKVRIREGKFLSELMHATLGDVEWDEQGFRENVEAALSAGSFILMIVVDKVSDELSRIIHFVNNCGRPAFSFAALELRQFENDQTEILVPRVVGDARSPEVGIGNIRRRWTEETFFKATTERLDAPSIEIITELYKWSEEHAHFVRFGTGIASGSFTFLLEHNGKSGSVYSVYTDGSLSVNFGYMEKIFSTEEIAAFRQELSVISTFENILVPVNYYYINVASAFPNAPYLKLFQDIVLQLKKRIDV
jgi:hypothetical protein